MNFIQIELIMVVLSIIIIWKMNQKLGMGLIFFILFMLMLNFLYFNVFICFMNFNFNDFWKLMMMSIVIFSSAMIFLMLKDYSFEMMLLNLMVLLGSLIIMVCDNLFLVYLGLELQTFSLFILMPKDSVSVKSSEAGLKYFILGALSSGLYLLGLSLIFYSGMDMSLNSLYMSLSFNLYLIKIASVLIILSLFFKLAMFPLYFWIPDIYEGSSWEVLALMSMMPKVSVLTLMIQLNNFPDLLLFSGLLSMVMGTFGALNQTKLKSLLAYSGMSHMGFMLLSLNLMSNEGYEVAFMYLSMYMLSLLGLFLIMYMSFHNKYMYVMELGGFHSINNVLAFSWGTLLLSIAGMPPLAGFMGKWFVLLSVLSSNYLVGSTIGIMFSAIAAGYYLSMMKMMYFQETSSYLFWNYIMSTNMINLNLHSYLLGFMVYLLLFLVLNPNPLLLGFYISFNHFF